MRARNSIIAVLVALGLTIGLRPPVVAALPAGGVEVIADGAFDSGLAYWTVDLDPNQFGGVRRTPEAIATEGGAFVRWAIGPAQDCRSYSGYQISQRLPVPAAWRDGFTLTYEYRIRITGHEDAQPVGAVLTAGGRSGSATLGGATFLSLKQRNESLTEVASGEWTARSAIAHVESGDARRLVSAGAVHLAFVPRLYFRGADCDRSPTVDIDDLRVVITPGLPSGLAPKPVLSPQPPSPFDLATSGLAARPRPGRGYGNPRTVEGVRQLAYRYVIDNVPDGHFSTPVELVTPRGGARLASELGGVVYNVGLEQLASRWINFEVSPDAPGFREQVTLRLAEGSTVTTVLVHARVTGTVPAPGIGTLSTDMDLSPTELVQVMLARGCVAAGFWLDTPTGARSYITGAPSALNAAFPARIAAGAPFTVNCLPMYEFPRGPRWTESDVPLRVCIRDGNNGPYTVAEEQMLRRALNDWRTPGSFFEMTFDGSCRFDGGGRSHSHIMVRFGDPVLCTNPRAAGCKEYDWDANAHTVEVGRKYMVDQQYGVLLHEIGHAIGFGHTDDICTLMSDLYCTGGVTGHEREALRQMYPARRPDGG